MSIHERATGLGKTVADERSRFRSFAWSGAAAIAGVYLLLLAASTSNLPLSLTLVGAGSACAVVSLFLVEKLISGWAAVAEGGAAWAGAVLLAVGGGLVALSLLLVSGFVALVGVALAMVGAIFVDEQVERGGKVGVSRWLVIAGLGAMIAGGALVSSGALEVGSGGRMLGVAIAVLGFIAFKVGLPDELDRLERAKPSALPWVTLAPALVLLPAGSLALLGFFGTSLWWLVGGISLFVLGLTVFVEVGLRPGADHTRRIVLLAAEVALGFDLAGYGARTVFATLGEWLLLMALIVIAFFLLGAFFVLRGEGLFILVLTAFVLLWTLHDRTLPPVESEPGGDQPIVVALGDSFIAGQGAFEFHAANNSIGAEGESSCRRSPSAFPELVFAGAAAGPAAGEWDVINLACSGAKIDDVGSRAQHSSGPGSSSQLDQLDALSEETKQRIGLVLLTIGGNDSGFATVAQACLLPADCSTRESFWLQRANRLGPPQEGAGPEGGRSPLEELFASVQQRMATIATEAGGSPAPVVVVPYPQVLDEVDCRLAIGEAERDFVVRFERVLNGAIVRAALATQGVYPFPGAFGAYRQSVADDGMREGRLLCDETPGVNFIHLLPHEGSVVGRLDPVHWKDGSLHPRLEGHQRMAEVLRPWLEDGLASVGAGSPFASYDDTDFADLCQTFAVDAAMALDAAAAGEADAGGAEPAGTEPAGGTDEGELAATGGAEPVDASCAEPISIITPEDDMSSSDELDAESAWITDQLRGTSQRVAMPLAALVASGALLSLALHAVAGRPLRWLFPQARPVAAGEEASGQEPDEPASARPQT